MKTNLEVTHLMANRRFAILALIGDGKLGPQLMADVRDVWPTPIGRKAFGCEIARLQHAGLVRSFAGKTRDGRSSLYRLTPTGSEFVSEHTTVLLRLVTAAKRLNETRATEAPLDLHGMTTAALVVRKQAEHSPGVVRDALLSAAERIEAMRDTLS